MKADINVGNMRESRKETHYSLRLHSFKNDSLHVAVGRKSRHVTDPKNAVKTPSRQTIDSRLGSSHIAICLTDPLANTTCFHHQAGIYQSAHKLRMTSGNSSDEGEITDGGLEKATTTLPQYDGTSIDRPNRPREYHASKSPEYENRTRDRRSRDRSRSPYYDRQPRGSKRAREDEFPDRSRDPRKFKVHYEDANQNYKRRQRVSYEDIDQGSAGDAQLRYDDHDRYPDKRARTRSRSPFRGHRNDDRDRRGHASRGGRNGSYIDESRNSTRGYSDARSREFKDQSVSKRGTNPLPADISRHEAKTTKGSSQQLDHLHDHEGFERYKVQSLHACTSLTF